MSQNAWSPGGPPMGGPPQGYEPQPQQQPGYGAPPQPQQQPGYGAPPQPQQPGYGAPPPQQQPGYGAPPPQQQPGYGAPPPPQQGYAPPPQQAYAPQGVAGMARAPDAAAAKGFLMGLIDFSFSSFIATKVLKVLYGVWLLAVGLGMIGGVFGALNRAFFSRYNDVGDGLLQLLMVPFAGAAAVVIGRVYFELVIVVFRIAENLTEMNRKMKSE